MAAGLAATAGSVADAGLDIVETNFEIKTSYGTCDAAFIYRKSGSHPGVLIWSDAFGLRPAMRSIAKRIAGRRINFQNPADMVKLTPLMASVRAPGNGEEGAAAWVATWADLVVKKAAALPNSIGAAASLQPMAMAW